MTVREYMESTFEDNEYNVREGVVCKPKRGLQMTRHELRREMIKACGQHLSHDQMDRAIQVVLDHKDEAFCVGTVRSKDGSQLSLGVKVRPDFQSESEGT